ncbi:MAG: OsmC family protein [Bacteroidetes bacterium]|nr:OsmC family protein [Bacteroidota bacterium]
MKHIVNTAWAGKMKFDTEVNGHHIILDAAEDVGGENAGPRPKALMLSALAGCTGMDVVSILKKMKVEPEYFNIKIEADLTEEHPKVYSKVHIIYEFKGKDLEIKKLQKAIELSQEKYCGVSAMYKKAMDVSYEIVVN